MHCHLCDLFLDEAIMLTCGMGSSLINHPLICGRTWPRLPCSRKCNSLANFSMNGPLAKLRVAHAPGMPETFFAPPRVSDPDMQCGTCVTHVPWCKSGSLTSCFFLRRWRGKRSRHSWRMRKPQITYLVRGTWPKTRHLSRACLI